MLVRPNPRVLLQGAGGGAGVNTHSGRFSSGNYIRRYVAYGLGEMNPTTDRTIEFNARWPSTPGNGMLGGIHGSPLTNKAYFLMTQTGKMRASYYTYSGVAKVVGHWSFSPTINTWYHIAITMDPTQSASVDKIRFILDGTDQGDPTIEATSAATTTTAATATWWSPSVFGSNQLPSNVWMDEYRIWDTALSAATIASRMNQQIDPATSGLVYYGRWNDDSWVDQTSNGYDMTASGSPTFSTEIPFT